MRITLPSITCPPVEGLGSTYTCGSWGVMAKLCAPAPITAANAITPIAFLIAYLLDKRLAVTFCSPIAKGQVARHWTIGRAHSNDFTGNRPRATTLKLTQVAMIQQPLVRRRSRGIRSCANGNPNYFSSFRIPLICSRSSGDSLWPCRDTACCTAASSTSSSLPAMVKVQWFSLGCCLQSTTLRGELAIWLLLFVRLWKSPAIETCDEVTGKYSKVLNRSLGIEGRRPPLI